MWIVKHQFICHNASRQYTTLSINQYERGCLFFLALRKVMFSLKALPIEMSLPQLVCYPNEQQICCLDSRKIQAGDIFIACRGEYVDGRDYIAAAIEQGAECVYWEDDGQFQWLPEWQVRHQGIKHLRECAGILTAQLYGNLSGSLEVIGVTGTNGKTSITQWLAQAFDGLNGQQSCAIMGTVGNGFWGCLKETTHTTLDAVSIQTLLRDFRLLGAKQVAMEVSSHGLHQYRVNGVPFKTAVFTNLSRDHLDYHQNMTEYAEVKKRLFYWHGLQNVVINLDDEYGRQLAESLKCERPELQVFTYGFHAQADIAITDFHTDNQGSCIALRTPWGEAWVHTRLLGRFNAQNFAACAGVLCSHGYAFQAALEVLSQIRPAVGRMDCVIEKNKPLVVVDYAHTPDALEKALTTLREILPKEGKLWCVFGCGGNRDRGKRPLMGAVVAQYADYPVITSDNPRMEDPEAIIADILPAVHQAKWVEADRRLAIEYAIHNANVQDIVLIAGKGHETYQDSQGVKQHFSDFEVAQQALLVWAGSYT